MDLPAYIREIGKDKFGKMFELTPRAVDSYLFRERLPKPDLARKIVGSSPVTWEGIYGEPEKIRMAGAGK